MVLSPVLALSALCVAAGSGFPVLFRHTRVGRDGRLFVLYKFRTMKNGRGGPSVTAADDDRITRVGRFLRRTKLDELPELWNVFIGDMSFVGPRPEAPRYVTPSAEWKRVLSARPGLTDPTTLALIDEESLLAAVQGDREAYYTQELLPRKLAGYIEYLNRRTWLTDLRVIAQTAASLLGRGGAAR